MTNTTVHGPSRIQKYNNMTHQARTNERQQDWSYAAKMWRMALAVAQELHWADKMEWCTNRALFCERMATRAAS